MSAEPAAADGDRVIEIVSAGALYRGGEWERKYWSCSRGKDRYPYPVGYHAVRHFSGISYTMEIQEGPRGPIFQVTSTEGYSSIGQTPEIAWKNFQKKTGAKVRNWQRRRSFPQKIDGVELFGFKNASVQRLLRELLVDSSGAVELNLLCPIICGAASQLTQKAETEFSDGYEDHPVCLGKTGVTKRSTNPIQEEGATKRVHYQDILPSVDNYNDDLDKSAHQSSNKGGHGSREQLWDVSASRCLPTLLEEIPCDSKCALVDDNLAEHVPSSSQGDVLSSSSYLGSEKSDLEAAEKEVAMSMMAFLLPQAIPLLKKTYRRKKVNQKKKEVYTVSMRTDSAQNPSADGCQGKTMPTSIGEGTNRHSSQTHAHGKPPCEMAKDNCANDDCMNDEPVSNLDNTKAVVADSFEDNAQISDDNTSQPMGAHHHESDDACSGELDENLKLLDSKREDHAECTECQVGVHDCTKTPDILYDHEKGQYILSDSLLACLEEEFGEKDNSYPGNYNNGNSDVQQKQVEQLCKDPTNGIRNGSSISIDGSDRKNFGNELIDACAQAPFARHGPAISNNDPLSKYPETATRGSDHHLEFMGCYLHPIPVLSIMLITKNNSSLHIYVHCGSLESCRRFLYVYNVTPTDLQETPPCFVGYTPLLLSSLEQSSTGNFASGRSGLQFTPDGQFLVLLSNIRIPCCRMQSMDCSCSMCKLDQCEDNFLKIVSVNFGYVSPLTKLMHCGAMSCFLICEPNYVVAAEDSRKLHIWIMIAGWREYIYANFKQAESSSISVISEEYVISSLGNVGPSILELRRMQKSSSLIIGHDGAGGFCLWDISKRTLLSTFAAPGNIVFQILPLGLCSLQEDIIHASVDDIEGRLREITVSDVSRKADRDSTLMSPGKDIAIWIMVSSASVTEYQHDLRAKEHNARWRLALLANKRIFMGNIFDPRATTVDACGNYGFAGTYGGLLYIWELSSGRKLAGVHCFNCGRVSCIAVDAKSRIVAVADDGGKLLLYTRNKV